MNSSDESLNAEQRACVEYTGRALLIIAGPGSGKTRCITTAIARLIESGEAHPTQICAITFTRLAAAEMRRRVIENTTKPAYGVTIGTFHSVCYEIVRNHWRELGYAHQEIAVYDRVESQKLLKEIIFRSRHNVSQSSVMTELDARAQGTQVSPGKEVEAVVTLYLRALKEHNAVDYSTVAPLALDAMRGMGRLAATIHAPYWKYLFVDEAHDMDPRQHKFIEQLSPQRLVAVGDPDQLIYQWRSASVELMRSMPARFGMEIKLLESNYRSCPAIIKAANTLIAHNAGRIQKMIRSAPGTEVAGDVSVIDQIKFTDEYNRLAPTGLAVLGRTHDVARYFWGLAANDPLRQPGPTPILIGRRDKFLERDDVKRVLAYLSWPDFPDTPPIMQRVLEGEGLSDLTIEKIRAQAKTDGTSFFDAAMGRMPDLAAWYAEIVAMPLLERMVFVLSRLRKVASSGGGMSADEQADIIGVLTIFVRLEAWANRTPARFMAWLNLRDAQDEVKVPATAWGGTVSPQFMTIHASKGLEFNSVMVVGLDDRTLPHKRSHAAAEDLEEERRLLFVAMTRARNHLVLVRPDPASPPSRFLIELGL